MTLFKEDSIAAMERLDHSPDVILLDPMFPERKKSGLIKKKSSCFNNWKVLALTKKKCWKLPSKQLP